MSRLRARYKAKTSDKPSNVRYRVRVDELCHDAKMTKMGLSRRMDVDVTTIRCWNRGEKQISFQNMSLLQEVFGVETIDLFDFTA